MASKFLHEEVYRGAESVAELAKPLITVCGAGALGSNLVDNLARQGFRNLRVIDRDRVEEHNISTQIYGATDIGAWKAEVLRNQLFRTVEIEIDAVPSNNRTIRYCLMSASLLVKDRRIVLPVMDL